MFISFYVFKVLIIFMKIIRYQSGNQKCIVSKSSNQIKILNNHLLNISIKCDHFSNLGNLKFKLRLLQLDKT